MMYIYISSFFFLLFIYPYLLYPLLLRLLPIIKADNSTVSDDARKKAAIIFCAYNEEDSLPEKIENIRRIKEALPDIEVLVYSDCSRDNTNQLLREASDILTPVFGRQRTGKVAGMSKLVRLTDANILICTDANVICDPCGIKNLIAFFDNPNIGAVAGTLNYIDGGVDNESVTASVGSLYWRLEEHIKSLESLTGSTMGADGSLFAVRKDNYPDIPEHLVDDLAASLSVLFYGQRCISAGNVHAYEVSVGSSAEEFSRKRRIACGSYSTYKYLLPDIRQMNLLDRFKFFSHKTLRWWGGVFLFLSAVFAVLCGWSFGYPVTSFSLIAVIVGFVWLCGVKGCPVVSTLYEVIKAVIATSIGMLESLIGKKYQTWTPAKTR